MRNKNLSTNLLRSVMNKKGIYNSEKNMASVRTYKNMVWRIME